MKIELVFYAQAQQSSAEPKRIQMELLTGGTTWYEPTGRAVAFAAFLF